MRKQTTFVGIGALRVRILSEQRLQLISSKGNVIKGVKGEPYRMSFRSISPESIGNISHMRPVPVAHIPLYYLEKYPISLKYIWQLSPKFRKHCIPISLKLIQISCIPLNFYKNIPYPFKFLANIPENSHRASFICT